MILAFNRFPPAAGDEFIIVPTDGTAGIIGTFNGLAEGAAVSSDFGGSGLTARITYKGGEQGNDVVIVVDGGVVEVPTLPGASETFTIAVVDGNLQVSADGVVIDSVPVASCLLFPSDDADDSCRWGISRPRDDH